MLKQITTYTGFEGDQETEVLYFNLTKTELASNLDLEDRFRTVVKFLEIPHELTRAEVQMLLELVKDLMRLSYGVRSADGKRFKKTPEIWQEFTETAAYDAFLFSLFESPEKANEFIMGVLPRDLMTQAVAQQEQAPSETVELPTAAPVLATAPEPSEQLTDEQLLAMSPGEMTREQLQRAFVLKSNKQ